MGMRWIGEQEGGKQKLTLGVPRTSLHLPPSPQPSRNQRQVPLHNPITSFRLQTLALKRSSGTGCQQKTGSQSPLATAYGGIHSLFFFFFKRPLPVDSKRVPVIVRLVADRGQQMPCDAPATCRKLVLSLGIRLHSTFGIEDRRQLPASGSDPVRLGSYLCKARAKPSVHRATPVNLTSIRTK